MKRTAWMVIPLLLLVVLSGFSGCDSITSPPAQTSSLGGSGSQTSGIWVGGTGTVTVTPDIAVLQVGVEAQEKTVAEAQAATAAAMDRVMAALTGNGIEEKDIQTQRFRIDQRTSRDSFSDTETITGYRITNTVTAKIRDIDKTGSIVDAAVKAGGDLVRIDGLSFTVEDPTAYYDEAREKATADAKDKAEKLADQNGVKLGEPTYIAENIYTSSHYGGISYGLEAPVPAPVVIQTPVSPGETEITLTVTVAYAIR